MPPKQKILSIRLAEKISKNPDNAKSIGVEINKKINEKKGVLPMIEIIISILAICLFVAAIRLAFRITWGMAKIIATVLIVLAIPVFVLCLIFAGGFVLLVPVALIAGAICLLKNCSKKI